MLCIRPKVDIEFFEDSLSYEEHIGVVTARYYDFDKV
jgi:hypothetical protein